MGFFSVDRRWLAAMEEVDYGSMGSTSPLLSRERWKRRLSVYTNIKSTLGVSTTQQAYARPFQLPSSSGDYFTYKLRNLIGPMAPTNGLVCYFN